VARRHSAGEFDASHDEASTSAETNAERDEARRWLTLPNESFDYVCELAGFNPMRTREHIASLLATNPGKVRKLIGAPTRPERSSSTARRRQSSNGPRALASAYRRFAIAFGSAGQSSAR
jgi:hypothetical protein